jgi:hypothetical protein
MHELDAVAPDDVLVAEDVRERVRVPHDVESVVEEQGELALGSAQPSQSSGCPSGEVLHDFIIGRTGSLLNPKLEIDMATLLQAGARHVATAPVQALGE